MRPNSAVHHGRFFLYFVAAAGMSLSSFGSLKAEVIDQNTIWYSTNSPRLVTENLILNANVTLTIQPGVVVKFEDAVKFDVNGHLLSEGAAGNPVIFTSIKDDASDGNDSNGDGSASSPSPTDWSGVILQNAGSADLEFTHLRYGSENNWMLRSSASGLIHIKGARFELGTHGFNSTANPGDFIVEGSTFSGLTGLGLLAPNGAAGNIIRNNSFLDNANALQVGGGMGEVSGNTFLNNTHAITVQSDGRPNMPNNRFGGNVNALFRINSTLFIPRNVDSSVLLSNNGINGLELTGSKTGAASTTWDNTVYPIAIRSGTAIMNAPGVLTIEEGVVIKSLNANITINGGLVVNGSVQNPVVFTSLRDDSVGGDTNTFEGNVSPAVNDWSGVILQNAASADINQTHFRYGSENNWMLRSSASGLIHIKGARFELGTHGFNSTANPGDFIVESSTFSGLTGLGLLAPNGAAGNIIRNNNFLNNTNALQVGGGTEEVSGNTFLNNTHAITVQSDGRPNMPNNRFGGNVNALFRINSTLFIPRNVDSSVLLSDNGINGLELTGSKTGAASTTWDNTVYPIVNRSGTATMNAPGVLTIEAGVIVKLFNSSLVINERIHVKGTQANPVTFTSLRDDSVGGDTNTFEGNVSPAVNDWSGVTLQNPASADINQTHFRYGSENNWMLRSSASGLIHIKGARFELGTHGFNSTANPGDFIVEGSTFSGLTGLGLLAPNGAAGNIIRNNSFLDNGNALQVGGGTEEVSGNTFLNNTHAITVQSDGRPNMPNNRFGANVNALFRINSTLFIPRNVDSSVLLSNNGINGLELTGSKTGAASTTWDNTLYPIVNRSGTATMNAPGVLTIEEGVVVKLFDADIIINGGLVVNGSVQNPVVFTSLRDDSVGGDTNTFEGNVSPALGDWIHLRTNASSTINNAVFRYSGTNNLGGLYVTSGQVVLHQTLFEDILTRPLVARGAAVDLVISSSTFQNHTHGILIQNSAKATIRQSQFMNFTNLAVQNDTGFIPVDARFNFWGDSSGPLDNSDDRASGGWYNPNGLGEPVSDRVAYTPWLSAGELTNPFINIDGGEVTNDRIVNLSLSVAGPATEMMISENEDFSGASFETFNTSLPYQLSAGDGLKTVYALFRTAGGAVSPVASDTVTLEEKTPSAAIVISSPSPVGLGPLDIELTASELLQSVPALTLTPNGQSAIPVLLSEVAPKIYNGSITIDNTFADGTAVFSFSGVDLSGSTGTLITEGGSFEIDTTGPAAPTLEDPVSLTAGAVSLDWSEPEPNSIYTLIRATHSITNKTQGIVVTSGEQSSFTDVPPQDGVYHYAVYGVDPSNNEGPLSTSKPGLSDRTPPEPVTTLASNLVPPSTAVLSWSPPPGETPALYRGYRRLNTNPTAEATYLLFETTSTAREDNLTESGEYHYGVTTGDALDNESDFGSFTQISLDITPPEVVSVTLTPEAPVGLGPVSILITFSESLDLSIPPTVTFIPNGGTGTILSSTSFTSVNWAGSLLISSTTPQGQASLITSGGKDLSNNGLITSTHTFEIDSSDPDPPFNVSVANIQNTGKDLRISWESNETGNIFTLFKGTGSNGPFTPFTETTALFYDDTPSAGPAAIFYALKETDPAGNQSILSSSTGTALPINPFLSKPTEGQNISSRLLRVEGVSMIGARIRVYESPNTLIGTSPPLTGNNFSFDVTLSSEGATTVFTTAVDLSNRESGPSASKTVIVNVKPAKPGTPDLAEGDTQLTLTWPANTEDDIEGYWIYRDNNSTPLNTILIPQGANPSFTDIALTNGRLYFYRVQAQDIAGQKGEKSNQASAMPMAGPGW